MAYRLKQICVKTIHEKIYQKEYQKILYVKLHRINIYSQRNSSTGQLE